MQVVAAARPASGRPSGCFAWAALAVVMSASEAASSSSGAAVLATLASVIMMKEEGEAAAEGCSALAPKLEESMDETMGPEDVLKDILANYRKLVQEYGGTQQYLLARHGASSKEFAERLKYAFPPREDLGYHDPRTAFGTDELVFSLTDLGFSEAATTKPPPYKSVCLALGEDILKNGFVTRGHPAVVPLRPPSRLDCSSIAVVLKPLVGRPRGYVAAVLKPPLGRPRG